MAKIGFIYPGQGSQQVGMGFDIYNKGVEGKKILEITKEMLGKEFIQIMFENDSQINKTKIAQPALFSVEMALTKELEARGIKADVSCGLSLGEYSAIGVACGYTFEDGLEIVNKRGKIMEEGCVGKGSMMAVLGLEPSEIQSILDLIPNNEVVSICNLNCPSQTVIGGSYEGLKKAEVLLEKKAKRIVPLMVEGPFHTKILKDAADKFKKELSKYTVAPFTIPIYTNVNGEKFNELNFLDILEKQIYSPVYFQKCIENMISDGVTHFIEVGPGKVLRGFVKKISKDVEVFNVATLVDCDIVTEKITGGI